MGKYTSIIVKNPIHTKTVNDKSRYYEPIDTTDGRLSGNSRDWGDASYEVQEQVIDKILNKANEYGLDAEDTGLFLGIIRAESGFNPDAAAGSSSAVGLGQFTRDTRIDYNLNDSDYFDADANLDAAVRYFIDCRDKVEAKGFTGVEEYAMIYKYYHDGLYSSKTDSGGLANFYKNVQPYLSRCLIVSAFGQDLTDIIKDIMSGNIANACSKIRSLFNIGATVISPIILDLDKDGVETTALNNGTYFDHDANGFSEQTGWASSDDGLLVMDRDNDGTIDNGTELFGNETLLANGTKATNGFQALKELDTNNDNKIDINDAAYANLKIWQDIDEDGYTSEGELHSFRLLFSV